MEANELRIGNLIKAPSGKIIKINEGLDIDFIKNYKPIPLTEEWLLKFGFYYSDDENEFLELQLMYKIKLYADNSNNFSIAVLKIKENEIEIKSVHQLQNLYFYLTGKELKLC